MIPLRFTESDVDLVPKIIQHCVPGAYGNYWPTHVAEVKR